MPDTADSRRTTPAFAGPTITMSPGFAADFVKDIGALNGAAKQMLRALKEAELQIEYLHERWKQTSSGIAVLARCRAAIAAAEAAGIKE